MRKLTPWLHIHGDNGLSGGLNLAGLLLVVLSQTFGLQPLGLLVDLLVVAAEQVDFVIVLLSSRGLGGVDRELGLLGSIGSVVLGWVTGQRCELGLPGEDVVVPAPGERVLLGGGNSLQLLEDLDIGLRRGVAMILSD